MLTDRLREIARHSAHEQAKSAEGPTLPQTEPEIPKDWLEAERKRLARELDPRPVTWRKFEVYKRFLLEAYKEENAEMLRKGQRMD